MIVLATHNQGKIEEMRAILASLDPNIRSAKEMGFDREVAETGTTLQENARLKARAIYDFLNDPSVLVIADDTGLFVKALGEEPGVYSARYAGEYASEKDNRDKLLAALEGVTERDAYFQTVICYVDAHGDHFVEGRLDGEITRHESGQSGFGYDKIFKPIGEKRTLAEMRFDEKNAISHRKRALTQLVVSLAHSQKGRA